MLQMHARTRGAGWVGIRPRALETFAGAKTRTMCALAPLQHIHIHIYKHTHTEREHAPHFLIKKNVYNRFFYGLLIR